MNAFLNPRNGASLTNVIDVTAHSISLFQENEQPKNITEIFIPQTSTSIAGPHNIKSSIYTDEHYYNKPHIYI